MNKIYTIGYAGLKIDEFVAALKQHGITFLIDVRSVPHSRFFPNYNEKALKETLAASRIGYKNLKDEFGARQYSPKFYTDGYLDFDKFSKSEQFKGGINAVYDLIKAGEVVCLMCAEKDPLNCHRAILCGKVFKAEGFEVVHIISTGIESHMDLETRLIKMHFKKAEQVDMFDEDERLTEAYRKHNTKIGYRNG